MFYDFPTLIKSKNVNPGVAMVSRPFLKAEENYVVSSAIALEVDAFARIPCGHLFQVSDKRFFTSPTSGLC